MATKSGSGSKGPFGNLTVGGLIGLVVAVLVLIFIIGRFVTRCGSSRELPSGGQTTQTHPVDQPQGTAGALSASTSDIVGHSWTARDGSELRLASDGSFIWYMDPADVEDNYIVGSYQVFLGEDARRKITGDLSSYGITSSEIDQVLSDDVNYRNGEAQLVCLVLSNDQVIMDGQEIIDFNPTSPAVGTYVVHNGVSSLDLLNMETANDWYFTRE